uniref:P27 family phage terminase small subunit n=1 Tax=Shewanella sp. TaxID=50422 RepID=UPI004048DC3A
MASKLPLKLLKPPKTMRKDQHSTQFFKEISQACQENKTITIGDTFALGMISEMFSVYKHSQDELNKTGKPEVAIEQTGDKGQQVQKTNQAFKANIEVYKEIMKGLSEFGLTPKSRSNAEKVQAETNSLLQQLFKGINDD